MVFQVIFSFTTHSFTHIIKRIKGCIELDIEKIENVNTKQAIFHSFRSDCTTFNSLS